jgi:hypothetical protein
MPVVLNREVEKRQKQAKKSNHSTPCSATTRQPLDNSSLHQVSDQRGVTLAGTATQRKLKPDGRSGRASRQKGSGEERISKKDNKQPELHMTVGIVRQKIFDRNPYS